jgi:hypothetical protein
MTKDTKNSNQSTITSRIKSSDNMLNMEESIEVEMNNLRDILRQKALEVNISNKDFLPDNSN